jgi:lipoprotein-releasing system permease protein
VVQNYEGVFSYDEGLLTKINRIDGVVATAPFVFSQGLVKSRGNASGALFVGIDTQRVGEVIDIKPMIMEGTLSSLDLDHDGLPGIMIGVELSRSIGAELGDEMTVISPQGRLTPLGRVPINRTFKVTALFQSGMYEYDRSNVYISLKQAQALLGIENQVSGIQVRVQDIYQSDRISDLIREVLPDLFYTRDWKAMNRPLLSALKLEKEVMFIILTMIVLVGALNIISTLVMVVMEKTKDIAILRAMGTTAKSIMIVFMIQGLIVGIVGTLAGLFSGLGACYLLEKYIHIDMPTDFYGLMTLPVRVETWDVVLVTVAAVVISFLATIYPSWRASRLNPVEALRYE